MSSRGAIKSGIRGFTLVEVIIVLIILSLIVVIATPSILQQLAQRRIRNAAAEIQNSIQTARSLASISSRPVEMWMAYGSSWNLPSASRGSSINIPNTGDVSKASLVAAKLSWYVVEAGASTAATQTIANSTANIYPVQVSLPDQTVITVAAVQGAVTGTVTNGGIRFFPMNGGIGNITAAGTQSTAFTQLTFTVCDNGTTNVPGYTVIVSQSGSVRMAGGASCP